MSDLVAWLRGVLDEIEVSASIESFAPDHASGLPHAIRARVEAEWAIVTEHMCADYLGPDRPMCDVCDAWAYENGGQGSPAWPCLTLRLLAYGHRFDAVGYRAEWAPERVSAQ